MSDPEAEDISVIWDTRKLFGVLETKELLDVSKDSLDNLKLDEKIVKLRAEVRLQDKVIFDLAWIERYYVSYQQSRLKDYPNERIIKLTKYELSDETQKVLEELLEKRQKGILSKEAQLALDILMDVYDKGLFIKSVALRVAVERGLIEPLSK